MPSKAAEGGEPPNVSASNCLSPHAPSGTQVRSGPLPAALFSVTARTAIAIAAQVAEVPVSIFDRFAPAGG